MSLVILGGLATSTLLNLFVIPPLYLRFARTGAIAPGGCSMAEPTGRSGRRPLGPSQE
jgi:hypothetical protein